MKKLIALFISIILVFSCYVITAFAEDNNDNVTCDDNALINPPVQNETEPKYDMPDVPEEDYDVDTPYSTKKFWRALKRYLNDDSIKLEDLHARSLTDCFYYNEKSENIINCAYVEYKLLNCAYEPGYEYIRIGDIVIKTETPQPLVYYFEFCEGEFVGIKLSPLREFYEMGLLDDTLMNAILESDAIEVVEDIVIGDADMDGELSVLDATEIQLVLASLKSWDNIELSFVADYDDDGQISVLDATAIQLKLAGLDG